MATAGAAVAQVKGFLGLEAAPANGEIDLAA